MESYLSDVVLFYASQAVFLVVFWKMCSIIGAPAIENYAQLQQHVPGLKAPESVEDDEVDYSDAYFERILI